MANQPSRRPFRLRELLLSQKLLWLIAWLLGIATVLSVTGTGHALRVVYHDGRRGRGAGGGIARL